MITLTVPRLEDDVYVVVENALLGPLGLDADAPEEIAFLSTQDHLGEERGYYNENFVVHTKVDGAIAYSPSLSDAIPYPSSAYPDRIKWRRVYGSSYSEMVVDCGVLLHGHVSVRHINGQTVYDGFRRQTVRDFIHYSVTVSDTNPNRIIVASKHVYTYNTANASTVYYSKHNYVPSSYSKASTYGNWAFKPKFSRIESVVNELCDGGPSIRSGSATRRKRYNNTGVNIDTMKGVATFWGAWLGSQLSPIEPVHLGILCSEAADRLNRSNVNMLEFISDLRNPKELIPKLRNLKSIRGVASTYLGINYGILPAKDDIKSIFAAFMNTSPRLDRYGFKVVHAGRSQSQCEDDYDFTCEQQVKLAVANEDSRLISLVNEIESWGFLPTFENIWDLVPFSFVIDWFIQVGDLLEAVDNRLRFERLNVKYVTTSQKDTVKMCIPYSSSSPYYGELQRVHYQRNVSHVAYVPPLELGSDLKAFDHWLEAGALIITRTKH